jgi:hypothetical protein
MGLRNLGGRLQNFGKDSRICNTLEPIEILDDSYIGGFRTFPSRTFYELDFLSFAKRFRIAMDIVSVYEEIFTAVVWSNESESFLNIEELNCTCRL